MNADSKEAAFQQEMIDQMVAGGWKLGDPAKYDRKLAFYIEDVPTPMFGTRICRLGD